MSRRYTELFVVDILLGFSKINFYLKNFKTAQQLYYSDVYFDGVIRQLEVIGESMKHIMGDSRLNDLVPSEWKEIVAFRNVIAHEYFGLDSVEVWEILTKDYPEFERQFRDFCKKYPDRAELLNALKQISSDHHDKEFIQTYLDGIIGPLQ